MDKGGKTVQDGLVVVVQRRPPNVERYGVEFSMNLDTSSSPLVLDAARKRKLVNKIAEVVDDRNASSIIIANISESHVSTNTCSGTEALSMKSLFFRMIFSPWWFISMYSSRKAMLKLGSI